MYCVAESVKLVNLPVTDISHIKYMKANHDNKFMCAITGNDIIIWFTPVNTL